MTHEINRLWQAEARIQGTKQLIRYIKRITRCKFIAEEKIRILLENGVFERWVRIIVVRKTDAPAD